MAMAITAIPEKAKGRNNGPQIEIQNPTAFFAVGFFIFRPAKK
jgi:hypothetical protein